MTRPNRLAPGPHSGANVPSIARLQQQPKNAVSGNASSAKAFRRALATSGRRGLTLCLLAVAAAGPADAARLYRFTNEQGRVEISHTIPTERVPFGYEVLDANSGRVIRSVEPQLSDAEYARKVEREQCEAALARLDKLYQSEDDISAAQALALRSIDNRIAHSKANLAHLEAKQTEYEAQAAKLERAGAPLPQPLIANLEKTRAQIRTLETELANRSEDRDRAEARYALELEMYREQNCLALSAGPGGPQLSARGTLR